MTTARTNQVARITVRNVGMHFGCEGTVSIRNEVVHVTRLFPYGQRSNAYAAAETWCASHGVKLGESK